jgi:hypothetical protein
VVSWAFSTWNKTWQQDAGDIARCTEWFMVEQWHWNRHWVLDNGFLDSKSISAPKVEIRLTVLELVCWLQRCALTLLNGVALHISKFMGTLSSDKCGENTHLWEKKDFHVKKKKNMSLLYTISTLSVALHMCIHTYKYVLTWLKNFHLNSYLVYASLNNPIIS